MTTMSDEGERTCPLCTEEMDLTDQQLKPCKCGYEICVWCWHHIIDMAEKDDTEGRCPACRTLYDKDKIVGMAANCERMMAEINAEKRQKSHKAKPKTSTEARKHLSSVRVIQRNLVYIIGLPSNLADENMLDRKEYFGQYGKVLKVSISRPAGASIQQASNNNTFSVYITYAKEEEAVRCIQAVHNFLLEGKPLRACFGTTKYCHAWLRNMTCSNPDCLYLHDIGTQEDSFTKDEIISSYTRNRVPQVATNNPQRRSGYMLPPPADDFCNSGTVSGKHVVKSAPNNTSVSHVKGSPPNTCAGRSTVLPAAASWGLRVSNCQLPAASMACSQGPIKLKSETVNSSSILSSVVASTKQTSAWYDDLDETPQIPEIKHVVPLEGRSKALEPLKSGFSRDCRTTASDISAETSLGAARTSGMSMSCSSSTLAPATEDKDIGILVPENYSNPADSPQDSDRQSNSGSDKVGHGCTTVDGNVQGLCLGLSSVNIDSHLGFDRPSVDQNQSSVSNHCSTGMTRSPDSVLRQNYPEPGIETLASVPSSSDPVISVPHVSRELSDWSSELQKQVLPSTGNEVEDVLVADDDQRNRLTDVINQPSYLPHLYHPLSNSNHSINHSWNNDVGTTCPLVNGNSRSMDEPLLPSRRNESVLSNGHNGDMLSSAAKLGKGFECPDRNSTVEEVKLLRRFRDVPNIDKRSVDIGENNIISDILSLDFDPWDDSLSSPNHFAKLLGETDQQNGSSKPSSSWKIPNSNQSRFSFARQENQTNLLEPSFGDIGHAQKISSTSQDFYRDGFRNGQSISNFEASSAFANSHSVFSSDKTAGVSRAKISAPPGFSAPSRAPPPGFSSQDRSDQSYDTTCSDNYLLGSSTLGNQYQPHLTGNTGDVEFIDPAILAVGKGRLPVGVNNSGLGLRSAFPSTPFSTSESDPRLQLLMQQSISAHQDLRFSAHQDLRFSAHQDLRFSDHSATSAHQDLRFSDHIADRFLPSSDAYIPSRLVTQNHNNLSPFAQMSLQQPRNSRISNSQWDGWNGLLTGNDVGMAEILRNERLGLNKTFPGNEEHKFHMSNSSDLYNRAFGM